MISTASIRIGSRWRYALACSLPVVAWSVAAHPASARSPHDPIRPLAGPCDENEGFHRLDFWIGEWVVFVGDRRVGANRIEKILDGCAIMERWTDTGEGQGKSLDRTMLTPDPDGNVRQLIEVSRDGGTSWEVTFDARYERVGDE